MNAENAAAKKKIEKIEEQDLFEQVAADVVVDATSDPQAYAEHTEVPEGGE